MKLLFSLLFVFLFHQSYAQSDTINVEILKWVETTKSFGYQPPPTFPDIYSEPGVLKVKGDVCIEINNWTAEVMALYYQALKDSAFIYIQRYSGTLDTSESEDNSYKKVVADQLKLDFGCDLTSQLNQLPGIKPSDPTEIELVHKYLITYFEAAYFKDGQFKIDVFNENVKELFPFLFALNQISQSCF